MNRLSAVQNFWAALARRERIAVALALGGVALMLVWWLALAGALQTLRTAPTQAAQLETQLQTLRGLQAQARSLQAQPKLSRDDAFRALEASVKQRLGSSAQLSQQGERTTLVLKGTSAQALAQWLAQARIDARVLPSEARLQRAAPAAGPATGSAAAADGWNGTLVLALPAG